MAALAGAAAISLAGCATPVPQALTSRIVSGSAASSEQVWPTPRWWQDFGSPQLVDFIRQAEADNQDLAAASARVLESRAQTTIQGSALFPQSAGQSLGQRASGSTTQSTGGQPNSTNNAFGANIGASYEVDLWGLTRANVRAARESLKSARFAREAVALTLTANVANAYFNVLTLHERIAIANEDIKAINSILAVIELRVSAGKSSHLDLAQERAQVEGERGSTSGVGSNRNWQRGLLWLHFSASHWRTVGYRGGRAGLLAHTGHGTRPVLGTVTETPRAWPRPKPTWRARHARASMPHARPFCRSFLWPRMPGTRARLSAPCYAAPAHLGRWTQPGTKRLRRWQARRTEKTRSRH